jgi:hypothetical protein
MKAEHDPLASHIFVSRRYYRKVNDTKSGKRRGMTARLSFNTGCELGFSREPRRTGAPDGSSCEAVNDCRAASRHASPRGGFFCLPRLRPFEVARVLVRFDHVASVIVNANGSASEITSTPRLSLRGRTS